MLKKVFVMQYFAVFASLVLIPSFVWAGGLVPCGGSGENACNLCYLIVGFHNLTNFLLKILISVTLAGLFFSGVMYIISAGDDGMMTSAKNFAKACLIGFAIVLGAWLIVNVTMWVISAQMPNIGHVSWDVFTCDYNLYSN